MIRRRKHLRRISLYHIRTMPTHYSVFKMTKVVSFSRYLVTHMRSRRSVRNNLQRNLSACVYAMLKTGRRYVLRVNLLRLRPAVRTMNTRYRCPGGTIRCRFPRIQRCTYVCISKTFSLAIINHLNLLFTVR
jgi:hypothetical protein